MAISGSFGVDRAGRLYASGYYQNGPRVLSRPLGGGAWTPDTVGLPFSVNHFNVMKPGSPGDVFGTDNVSLSRESQVTLRIYSLLGQKVATLVDEVEGAGYKSVRWNASSVASGTYLVRLDATTVGKTGETFTKIVKMEMLK